MAPALAYRALPESDSNKRDHGSERWSSSSQTHILGRSGLLLVALISWTVFVGLASYATGKAAIQAPISNINAPTKLEIFRYNRTFAEAPSVYSDRAWTSIFPSNGTFFKHPTIAPHLSTLSVYHQLHCVNGIRQGYWALFEAAKTGIKLTDVEMPRMSTPSHIRHCLDLLRQSLMCHADTTIEVNDDVAHGVHGFGVEHQCKDWNSLLEWTERWHRNS